MRTCVGLVFGSSVEEEDVLETKYLFEEGRSYSIASLILVCMFTSLLTTLSRILEMSPWPQ